MPPTSNCIMQNGTATSHPPSGIFRSKLRAIAPSGISSRIRKFRILNALQKCYCHRIPCSLRIPRDLTGFISVLSQFVPEPFSFHPSPPLPRFATQLGENKKLVMSCILLLSSSWLLTVLLVPYAAEEKVLGVTFIFAIH